MIRHLLSTLSLFLLTLTAPAQTFRQAAPLQLADGPEAPVAAAPYPSALDVSGLKGIVGHLVLTLHGFSHNNPDAVDLVLVAPDGTASVVMSDAGGAADIHNLVLQLDESAPAALPDFSTFSSGAYRPANWGAQGADRWPAPAPVPAQNGLLPFRGLNPNGTWRLYAVNDVDGTIGGLAGGWSLTFSVLNGQPASFAEVEGTCTGAGNAVQLTWSTTHEYNSAYFVVERQGGGGFAEIGRVPAAGFSTEERQYTYSDASGNGCKGVYRLRLVFRDGSSRTSNAVAVKPESKTAMRYYPNPATSYVLVEPAEGETAVRLTLTDASGQVRQRREGTAATGRPLRLDLSVPPGRYYLRDAASGLGQWLEVATSH